MKFMYIFVLFIFYFGFLIMFPIGLYIITSIFVKSKIHCNEKFLLSNTFLNQSFYGLFEMINKVQLRKLFRPCYVKSKWLRRPYFDATRHISSRKELFFVFVFILKLLDSLVCQTIRICCKNAVMHIKRSYFASTFCLNC